MRKEMQEKEEKSVKGTPKINRSSRRMSRTVEDMSKWEEKKRKRLEAARKQKEVRRGERSNRKRRRRSKQRWDSYSSPTQLALAEQKKVQSAKKMSRGSRSILRKREKKLKVEREIEARRLRWRRRQSEGGDDEDQAEDQDHGAASKGETDPKDDVKTVKSAPKPKPEDGEKVSQKPAIGDRLLKMAETYRSKRLERIKKEREKQ